MALALKENGMAVRVIGVDTNESHCQKALQLQLVDEVLPLREAVSLADFIILSVPVNVAEQLLPLI